MLYRTDTGDGAVVDLWYLWEGHELFHCSACVPAVDLKTKTVTHFSPSRNGQGVYGKYMSARLSDIRG